MAKKVLFKDVEYTRLNGECIQFRGIFEANKLKVEILRIDLRGGIHPAPVEIILYEIIPYIKCLQEAQNRLYSFKTH